MHRIATPARSAASAVLGALMALMVTAPLPAAARAQANALDGYTVVRVRVPGPVEMQRLESLVHDIWSEQPRDGLVEALASPAERTAIDESGLHYEVVVDDVAGLLAAQFSPRARVLTGDPAAVVRDFFAHYHPYEEIVAHLQALVAAHPRLASMVAIGTTVEGRPISGLRITAHPHRKRTPAVAVWGGQHAREWVTTMIPPYLATQLLEGYDTDPAIRRLVRKVEWLVVPVVNVDGYVHTWSNPMGLERFWRKNRRDNGGGAFGVDLNRNWLTGWDDPDCSTTPVLPGSRSACPSSDPTSDVYRGPAPFSEPETRALRDHLTSRRGVYAMADLHSFAQLIMWPNGFTDELTPDHPTFQRLGSGMHDLVLATHGMSYATGPLFSTIYPVRGVAADWTYHQLGMLSFVFEVRPGGATTVAEPLLGFVLPEEQILPTAEELLPALRLLGESRAARRFPKKRKVVPGICRTEPRRCKHGT